MSDVYFVMRHCSTCERETEQVLARVKRAPGDFVLFGYRCNDCGQV